VAAARVVESLDAETVKLLREPVVPFTVGRAPVFDGEGACLRVRDDRLETRKAAERSA
jgi:hypothetical protein